MLELQPTSSRVAALQTAIAIQIDLVVELRRTGRDATGPARDLSILAERLLAASTRGASATSPR